MSLYKQTPARRALWSRLAARWRSCIRRTAYLVLAIVSGFVLSPLAVADWEVRADGAGPANIGMPLAAINQLLGEHVLLPEDPAQRKCFHVSSADQPRLDFMFENGVLTRIDIAQRGARTDTGLSVGDPVGSISKMYGAVVRIDPHYLDPNTQYMTVLSKDHKFGIRFEVSNDKIRNFYVGVVRAIERQEGCE